MVHGVYDTSSGITRYQVPLGMVVHVHVQCARCTMQSAVCGVRVRRECAGAGVPHQILVRLSIVRLSGLQTPDN